MNTQPIGACWDSPTKQPKNMQDLLVDASIATEPPCLQTRKGARCPDPWILLFRRTTLGRLLCPSRKIYPRACWTSQHQNHKFVFRRLSIAVIWFHGNHLIVLLLPLCSLLNLLLHQENRACLAEHLNKPKTDSCGSWPFWVWPVMIPSGFFRSAFYCRTKGCAEIWK